MAYTITKEYLDKHKTVTEREILSLNEKLKTYEMNIKSRIDTLTVRHAALVCDYEEQESRRSKISKIITRQEAMSQGLKRYFTGLPCKNGHYSFRYTKTAQCNTCINGVPKQDNYHEILKEKAAIKSNFEEIRLRFRFSNSEICLGYCLELLKKTYPILEMNDVLLRKTPLGSDGTSAVWKINAPSELKSELMRISNHSLFGDPL